MDVQKYLSNFFRGTKNPSLKAMHYFMENLGYPDRNLKILHIAGTNGKGSCAEMLTNILINAGYKVGKFISPHLIRYNERISVNNKVITDQEMEDLINKLISLIDKYNGENTMKITLFELETTMALLYFYLKKCDFVVLETGLGGLYDCTNIVNSMISIITSIGYDHINILGNTLEDIAKQKAGIIKPNTDTVFLEQGENVNEIIKNTCKEQNTRYHGITENEITNYKFDNDFQNLDFRNFKNIKINLKGKRQIYNAAICLECVNILREKAYNISDIAVKKALRTVVHKGRFEKIYDNPTIIYDGCHNEPAIINFKNNVNMYYKNNKKVYLISILKTKDYNTIIKELVKDTESIFIFTTGNDNNLYVDKSELLNIAKNNSNNNNLYAVELKEAIINIKEKYKDRIVFIIGSFYIYGDVINYINEV